MTTSAWSWNNRFMSLPDAPQPSSLLVWRPGEVCRSNQDDGGWWIASALSTVTAGDRGLVYQTVDDQGIVGVFDYATAAFKHPDLGYAAYGRFALLPTPVKREVLLSNRRLSKEFAGRMRRRHLSSALATAIAELTGGLPAWNASEKPLPGDDEDWEWVPADPHTGYGLEATMRDAIRDTLSAWRRLGYERMPQTEVQPRGSKRRVDLYAPGVVTECKLHAGIASLEQLLDYLRLFAESERIEWNGNLVVAYGYTRQLSQEISARNDVRLWRCGRTRAGTATIHPIAV